MIEKTKWYVGDFQKSLIAHDRPHLASSGDYVDKDPAFDEFLDSFHDFMIGTLLKNVEIPKGMDIEFGPFCGKKGASVLVRLSFGGILDIGIFHGDPNGFRVGKFKTPFTMKGVTEYINEEWVPNQSKKVKAVLKRKSTTDELQEALSDFTTMVVNHNELSPFLISCIRSWGTINTGHTKEYHFICQEKSKKIIKEYSGYNFYKVIGSSRWKHDVKLLPNSKINLLWIVFNKTRNMIQIGYFQPYTGKDYGGKEYLDHKTSKSSWVAPKNMMKYLDKMAANHPTLAILLADPNMKSK